MAVAEAKITKYPNGLLRGSVHSAYGKFGLVLLAISVLSLVPQYFATLVRAPSELSTQLLVHGAAFLVWYVLFCVQSGLVSSRQIATHRTLGCLSIVFAVLLAVSGMAMLLGTVASYDPAWSEQHLRGRTSFVWAIAHTLLFFVLFYAGGILMRKRSAVHKRLMLLCSLSMMSASITRFAYLPLVPIDGTAFTLLLTYGLLAVPLFIDRRQRGRIHPVIGIGTLVYVVTQLLAIGLMPSTELGRQLAFGI